MKHFNCRVADVSDWIVRVLVPPRWRYVYHGGSADDVNLRL